MPPQLKVTWNNAGSTLIGNGTDDDLIIVAQNNAARPEDKSQRNLGARIYSLEDNGDVKVTFNLKLHLFMNGIALNDTILKVVQRFHCNAGVVTVFSYDTQGNVNAIPGLHPLVALPSAQQSTSLVNMAITTDFVDVTLRWLEVLFPASSDDRKTWETNDHFNTKFRVLACLNGFPTLWFASIPQACEAAIAVSALVFFRPAGYPYHVNGDDLASVFSDAHKAVDPNIAGAGFFRIWRFLLSPVCNRIGVPPDPAAGTPAPKPTDRDLRLLDHWLPVANVLAGFERALRDVGKPVVVLFPAPEAANYGVVPRAANTASLFDLAETAVACLHAMDAVMAGANTKNRFSGLRRLGVAGFSFGGVPMWQALSAATRAATANIAKNRIQEVYAFDANGWSAQQAQPLTILTAARQTGQLCLRVAPATPEEARLDMFTSPVEASAHPDLKAFPDFYNLKKERNGGNPLLSRWYHHFVKIKFDATSDRDWFILPQPGGMTNDRGARHQFSVFGGEDSNTGVTYFRRFLELSKF